MDDAPQVDVEHLAPVVDGELPREAPVDDPGVVDRDVQSSEPVHDEVGRLLDGLGVTVESVPRLHNARACFERE